MAKLPLSTHDLQETIRTIRRLIEFRETIARQLIDISERIEFSILAAPEMAGKVFELAQAVKEYIDQDSRLEKLLRVAGEEIGAVRPN
jgi:vacuolar-type H+-ATPase subunit I/STV1